MPGGPGDCGILLVPRGARGAPLGFRGAGRHIGRHSACGRARPFTGRAAKAASQVRALASALDVASARPPSAMEQRHRRMALALNDDLSAALAALERNPGNQRASRLAGLSIQRLADTQKRLYEERSL